MYKGSRRRLSIARGDMRFGLRFGPHCVCCAVRWANRVRKRVRNAVVEISQNGVYFRRVAPLAQRLEQRPFKSWVVGSNPTGGTAKPLETLTSKGFSIPAILDPNAIRRTHIVRTPNTDRHIIIRAGKHPAILSANAPSSETKPPPTGRILPLADAPTSKTPSQWNNLPVNQSSSGIKLPVTGGNGTQIDLSASEKLQ